MPETTNWIGRNLRITLLIFGIVSYLFGIHPGGELMVIAAVGLMSWRDYP